MAALDSALPGESGHDPHMHTHVALIPVKAWPRQAG